MSLIKCPKCGEMFSDSYKTCPFCEEDEAYYSGKLRKSRGRRAAESRRRKTPSVLGPVAIVVLILLAALVVWLIFGDQIKEAITGEKPPITDVDKPDDTIDKPDDTPVTPTISLNRTVLVLNVGEKDELKVNGTEDTVEWSSSAPTVASVNSAGEVTALTKGNAVITAEVNGESVTCTVTVKDESDAPDDGSTTTKPDDGSTTTKPDNSNKPSTGTTKVDVSKLKLKLTMGEWVSTIESPNSDGNFEITSVQGEEWTLAVDGTTAAVIWSAESGNSVATVSGDTLKVTGSSSGRYTTITGKVGDATIKLVVRIR
jgi:hypothetical protein